ncbi:Universal stress protein [Quillaja saponaria]|uniref:Universal stress protein n=1 Tax=Quillaja saponaria TaxID=32244 RepID=A0AAD7KXS9_QUISA|nr:Universal stress protein [Quillaja saponaria]
MKERLCLEVERLGLCTMIMGSRGFGASGRNVKGRLGSVSDYYVHHCGCPVIVVRCTDEKDGNSSSNANAKELGKQKGVKLPCPVVIEEDEQEYHDALDKHRDVNKPS